MMIYNMKTNYQENPVGIELGKITFSWKIKDTFEQLLQSPHLLISSDAKFDHIVFDRQVKWSDSVAYTPDVELCSGIKYYWKLIVYHNDGSTVESEIGSFEGGHPDENWIGKWIKPPFVSELHPVFRKEFELSNSEYRNKKNDRLYVCGLGLYEVYINGTKVGDDYLTPYFTDYRYWIQYQTYDISSYLKCGANVIDVFLGNGWYKGKFGYLDKGQLREYYGHEFLLIADLYLCNSDNHTRIIGSDENWTVLKSPIITSGIYDGEMYDSRMDKLIKNPPRRNIHHANLAESPIGKLCPMVGTNVVKHESFVVKEIIHTPSGEVVLDFGQEITGWVEFLAYGPAGRRIILEYGEILQNSNFYRDNLRSAAAAYTFISNGKKQLARPHFTYFGFRYVKVSGMEVNESNISEFRAYAIYSNISETGRINTSNEKINKLIENAKWSQKDNFLDIPMDCPQRDERLGWTGDAQIFCATASYNAMVASFFRKYLKDMALEQNEKGGAVPYVVPDVLTLGRIMNDEPEFDMSQNLWGEAGSSVWGDAATIIPWTMYMHYGNKEWLSEQYPGMKAWIDFIIRMDKSYCKDEHLWSCGFHFGDWLSLDSEENNNEGGTDKTYVASAFYMHSAQLTAKAAKVLGIVNDEIYYNNVATEVRDAIRKKYISDNGKLIIHTQTAYALGIHFNIFNGDEVADAGDTLCELLKINHMHLSTGFVGTAYLCSALTKSNHGHEAYSLILNEDYPGWLYEVNLGATTIWERWNSLLPDGKVSDTGMNSLNHYAYGSILNWIYESVCGINLDESAAGGKTVILKPNIDERFSHVEAEYKSMAGDYKVGWKIDKDMAIFKLHVPFNCKLQFISPLKISEVIIDETNGKYDDQYFYSGDYIIKTSIH